MNTSGDAAEQVVRLSLEGVEVAAKITGSAAKEVSALLIAALKNRDKNKVKGRQRLTAMLRSGKELTIFTVKNQDMARFVADAKRYGVVYCVLREAKDNPQGISEIMVRAEDAAKINRIVENIKIATVSDPETIRESLSGEEKETSGQPAPEQTHPQKNEDDRLLDEMLSGPADRQETLRENPTAARTERSRPSEPSSKTRENSEGASKDGRPSVREELREIRRGQEDGTIPTQRNEPEQEKRPQQPIRHKQPPRKKRSRKSKER